MKKRPKLVIKRSKHYVPPQRIYGKLSEYWWDITPGTVARIEKDGRVIFEKKDCEEQCVVESQRLLPLFTQQRQTGRKAHPWGIRVLVDRPNELAIEPGFGGRGDWDCIPVDWSLPYVPIEKDWRRFSMGYLAAPVSENEMVRLKVRGDVEGKAGVYYFVVFRLSIKTAIDSQEIVAFVSDVNGNLDHSLSERFLEIAQNNLSKDWTQPDVSFSRKVFAILRDKALDYMSDVEYQKELTARHRNDVLIEIWRAAMEQAYDVQKQRVTAKLKAATDNRVVRMYQEVLTGLESRLQNTRAALEARKRVSIAYEQVAYGLMELQHG